MKKLYLLLLLSLLRLPTLHAQQVDSLRLALDHVFAPLDKSQVPTGRLLEAAEPLLPMAYFDGLRLDDTSRTSLAGWGALYATAAARVVS